MRLVEKSKIKSCAKKSARWFGVKSVLVSRFAKTLAARRIGGNLSHVIWPKVGDANVTVRVRNRDQAGLRVHAGNDTQVCGCTSPILARDAERFCAMTHRHVVFQTGLTN